jgi:heavy metal efflux system protein
MSNLATSMGLLTAVENGGLVTCTLLTLLVLPAIYRWFEPAAADRSA